MLAVGTSVFGYAADIAILIAALTCIAGRLYPRVVTQPFGRGGQILKNILFLYSSAPMPTHIAT